MAHTRFNSIWAAVTCVGLLVATAAFATGCDGGGPRLDAGTGDGACSAAQLGCECGRDARCDRGQCVAGTCRLCTRGEEECLCRVDGSCQEELLCDGDVCRACPDGQEGCACRGDQCDEGLTCESGTCAPIACPPGTVDCACRRQSSPECDYSTCLGDGFCRECDADRAGCPCVDDTCATGLLCEAGACRTPRTCEDMLVEGFCVEHQRCTETGDVDAQCEAESCEDGYVWERGRCVPGLPNCSPNTPGSLLAPCTGQLRQCVEGAGTASCGECLGGSLELQGVCVGRLACGDTSCLDGEYCDSSEATPVCRPLPCPAGQAKPLGGSCSPCSFSCAGVGLTGRVWPFRTVTDTCVCETLPGYFMPPGGDTQAEVCDQDNDGWVREEVRDSSLTIDPTLVQNARCGLFDVTSVVLRDEHGQDAEVASCIEGLILNPGPTDCSARIPLPLVESLRNDTPGELLDVATPPYGSAGRRLRAQEVNGLSKACVSALGDFDDNGVEDYLQVQQAPATLTDDPAERLRSFAYFMETHRAYVEVRTGQPRLVIEERFRCDPRDFPLRYDPSVNPAAPTDGYVDGVGARYWRSCQRGVRPGFDPTADPPLPGYDFAQWSCPNGTANCDGIPVAAPHPTRDLRTPIAFGTAFPTNATLCEMNARFPADGVWRGMNHHSQFRCVGVGSGPGQQDAAEFGPGGGFVMNRCEAVSCAPSDPDCVEARGVVASSQAEEPELHCRALSSVTAADFGFAAQRYVPYGIGFAEPEYQGGCVSEDEEYHPNVCPTPVFSVMPTDTAFGAQTCYLADCPIGQANCDGNDLNGCELVARDNVNCSGCGTACAPNHATGNCSTGFCVVSQCDPGWGNCDGNMANGCEQRLNTLNHCGGCNVLCDIPSSGESCVTGTCQAGACAPGTGNCDGNPGNGCETTTNTNTHCGGCNSPCNPTNGTGQCNSSGVCIITGCAPGWGNCDNNSANGCETRTDTTSNCGACGASCSLPNAAPECTGGAVCTVDTCSAGWDDCTAAPGCETNIRTNSNCGDCGVACAPANASGTCSTGSCRVTACNSGYANCDGDHSTGCNVRLNSNPSCGAAMSMGEKAADSECGAFCTVTTAWSQFNSTSGSGEAYFRARAVDALGVCSEDLIHRVTMTVPAGMDYDLYVYDACGGNLLGSSTNGVSASETVTIRREDGTTNDRSFDYWVEVRWFSGSSCAEWTLKFEGRQTC
ncbi:MAG: hypothetical protein H6726_00320 [Sandaracinaceae bacterium]|nr:hypothetical protein [Myxococcales bacterium]MCB9656062.1 hypothetical protein [Sandaracinaceae bacterium]